MLARMSSEDTTPESTEDGPGTFLGWLRETGGVVLAAVVLAVLVRTFVFQPFVIPSESMLPTILVGDHVVAEKVLPALGRDYRYGDIVVFRDPDDRRITFIKRIIAVGGQTVDLRGGDVYADGIRLAEPYVHGQPTDAFPDGVSFPLKVPAGSVWLMGDNRGDSGDARAFGPVSTKEVTGRAVLVYWPVSRFGRLR